MGGENSGRVVEFPVESLAAALAQTRTIEQAAELVGCTPSLIQVRRKESALVALAVEEQSLRLMNNLAKAIQTHRGIISRVATATGLSQPTVKNKIRGNPVLRELWESVRETVVDTAEENIFNAVEGGDLSYSWKLLQTLGKNRGYTERREVEVESTVTHRVSTPQLLTRLERLAGENAAAIEAEFETLGEEDRGLLTAALERAATEAGSGV